MLLMVAAAVWQQQNTLAGASSDTLYFDDERFPNWKGEAVKLGARNEVRIRASRNLPTKRLQGSKDPGPNLLESSGHTAPVTGASLASKFPTGSFGHTAGPQRAEILRCIAATLPYATNRLSARSLARDRFSVRKHSQFEP